MRPSGIITLTTDFGQRDWYVGTVKGVILGIHAEAKVVDLTHEISAGDICSGAFALAASFRYFPQGTVHLAVVDPGVGSARKAIVVRTANFLFVGPDNGLLALALEKEKVKELRSLDNTDYFLQSISSTFHGRDVFGPVAAHLSRGVSLNKLGTKKREYVSLTWPEPKETKQGLRGVVLYIDHFGNAITNISIGELQISASMSAEVFVRGKRTCPFKGFYQAVPQGQPVAVPGSSGFMEVCVNGGNAARALRLRVGDSIVVSWRPR